MKHLKYFLILAVAVLITSSCHKDPPKQYDETDMTVTFYNTDFSFSSYTNFVLPDSTVLKTNYMTESEITNFYKEGGISDQTLQIMEGRFTGLGYNSVDSLAHADFIALPTILMMQTDQTIWYNPGWWWGYPGYGWGWGWGWKSTSYYYWWYPPYSWYPGYPITVSTQTGTLIFEMIDAESYRKILEWNEQNPNPPTASDDVPALQINWQAYIEGYTTDDATYNKERALRGVEEAFNQSPYLRK